MYTQTHIQKEREKEREREREKESERHTEKLVECFFVVVNTCLLLHHHSTLSEPRHLRHKEQVIQLCGSNLNTPDK